MFISAWFVQQVARELTQLASTDGERLQRYSDAADMLTSVRAADYPRRWQPSAS